MDVREKKSELTTYIKFLNFLTEQGHNVEDKMEEALNELHKLYLK